MKLQKTEKNKLIKIAIYLSIVLIGIFLIFQITILKEIISLLLISFIIAYSLKPFQKMLIERGMKPKNSAVFLILGLFIGAIMILTILIPSIMKESSNIGNTIEEFGEYFSDLHQTIRVIDDNEIIYTIFNTANNKINKGFINLLNRILEFGAEISENILVYFIIPIIVYYFLCDSEYLRGKVLLVCPLKSREIIKKINKDVDKILGRYMISQFLLCALITLLTFLVLISVKVKFPLILSILNGIFNIIPYFGPLFGAIPCILVAFLTSPKTALYASVGLYIIQFVEGNIISPKVTGDSVSIHPVGVIIILLIGEKLGGFLGMVLAVPISVIIKVIYEDLNYYLF